MIKLDLHPAPRVLNQFAWIAAFALLLIAGFLTRGDAPWHAPWRWQLLHPAVLIAGAVGVLQLVLLLVGVRQPTRWLYVGAMVLAFPIGFLVSHVLIAAIYYLVITPIALVFRLMGRDVLGRRIDRSLPTYWHVRAATRKPDSYFKLY